jgi:hypothetical protein
MKCKAQGGQIKNKMKQLFLNAAKKAGCTVSNYASYRSDMGCQVFEMQVTAPNGNSRLHADSYFVGNPSDKPKLIDYFKNTFLPELCK